MQFLALLISERKESKGLWTKTPLIFRFFGCGGGLLGLVFQTCISAISEVFVYVWLASRIGLVLLKAKTLIFTVFVSGFYGEFFSQNNQHPFLFVREVSFSRLLYYSIPMKILSCLDFSQVYAVLFVVVCWQVMKCAA